MCVVIAFAPANAADHKVAAAALPLTASGRQREACAILVGGRFFRSPVGRVPIVRARCTQPTKKPRDVTNTSSFVMAHEANSISEPDYPVR